MFQLAKKRSGNKIVLAAVCLLLLVTVMVSSALAETNTQVSVGTLTDIDAGATELSLPVSISNNPGLAGFDLRVTYPQGLTLTGVEKAGVLSAATTFSSTLATNFVGMEEATDISGDGVLFNLIFSVADDAQAGDYAVSVGLTPTGAFINDDIEDIPVEFTAGKITVAAPAATGYMIQDIGYQVDDGGTGGVYDGTKAPSVSFSVGGEAVTLNETPIAAGATVTATIDSCGMYKIGGLIATWKQNVLLSAKYEDYTNGDITALEVSNCRGSFEFTMPEDDIAYLTVVFATRPATVSYAFEYEDEEGGADVPETKPTAVTEQLPEDKTVAPSTNYTAVGTPAEPYIIDDEGGIWEFTAWNPSATIKVYTDETISGTWVYYAPTAGSTAFDGKVIAAPLHDNANAIADEELFASYAVSYAEGTATVTATDLKEHANANDLAGNWVGAAIALPDAFSAYGDIWVAKDDINNLAAAGLTGPEYTDAEGQEYLTIYLDAATSALETFYFSFDAGQTVQYIMLDYSAVECYVAPLTGGETITKGGEYQLAATATGTITISTTEPVTIVGNGAAFNANGAMTSTPNSGLYFDYTVAGADLTLQNVYISNASPATHSIDFTGTGNKLSIAGVNVLDHCTGFTTYAGIHVGTDADLLITGTGTLYLYKSSQGAAIGGANGEQNGNITFGEAGKGGPTIFAKGTKQGAVIGSGSGAPATGAPGVITFNSGVYNLLSNSRGAVIGGSAGGVASSGTNVYFNGGSVNINVDFSGSAVGGGGYDSGNDAAGGNCYISGGSLRVFVDKNAAGNTNWGELTYGVNDVAITAKKMNNPTDEAAVYRLIFDTTQVSGSSFTVKVDDKAYYSGGLHEYKYTNQDLDKGAQVTPVSTPANWIDSDDTNLYLYVTGADHTVDVNGSEFSYLWDADSQSFALDAKWDGSTTTAITPVGDTYTVSTGAELAWIGAQVDEGESFSGKTVVLAADINLNDQAWNPIGDGTRAFAGTFDGAGYEIRGLNVNQSASYAGLFANSVGTVKDFTLRGAVTVGGYPDFVAAVVGFNAGTVQDVFNYATVTAYNGFNVGGIAGLSTSGIWVDAANKDAKITITGATGLIERCANYAAVTGNKKVGGIAGENAGTISQCFNSGQIDGIEAGSKNGVGGIAGRNGNNNTAIEIALIDSCYNTGTVGRGGQKWVGGMAGFQNSKSSVTNSYVSGNIVIGAGYDNPIVGNQEGAASNNYSLSGLYKTGSAEKEVGIILSADALKAAASLLGASFVTDPNGGYPLLKWQLPAVDEQVTPSVEDGAASGAVDELTVEDNSLVSIEATTSEGDSVKTELSIAAAATTELSDAIELTVSTDQASITFDGAAVDVLSNSADGLKLVTEKLSASADPTVQELINSNVPVYEFTLTNGAGDGVWTEEEADGAATIVVPYTLQEGDNPDAIKVFYIANGKKYQVNDAQYFTVDGKGFVRFQAEHFSTYSIENNVQMVYLNTTATSLNANDSFTVDVKVATNSANASFNAVSAKVTYDAAKLEYLSIAWNDSEGNAVSDNASVDTTTNGVLKLNEYGDAKISDANGDYILATLTFKVKNNVAATATAKFSVSDAAIGSDPVGDTPAVSALCGDDISVAVHNVVITLQKGAGTTMTTVKAYAKYDEAGLYTDNTYTTAFTVPTPTANDGYRLAADTDAEKLWKKGWTTTYFTSAELLTTPFTANTSFSASAIQIYDVAFYAADGTAIGETQVIDKNASATAPADPTAADGMSFAGWFAVSAADDEYDGEAALFTKAAIDAAAVTGDKLYKAYFSHNSYSLGELPAGVTVTGGLDGEGGTTGDATHNTDVTFTYTPGAATDGNIYSLLYSVGEGGDEVLTPDGNGVYTIPGAAITDNLTISVELTVDGTVSFIECDAYKGAPSSFKVLLLTLNQDNLPTGDKLYKYDGKEMYLAHPTAVKAYGADGAYAFFVPAATTSGDALQLITMADGATPAVGYDGDVNESGLPEINDAQLVWSLYNAKNGTQADATFTVVSMLKRLQADVNGDGTVDMQDARAVVNILNQ